MRRFSTCLLFVLSVSLSAQEQLQVITAGSSGQTVRFTSSTGVTQIRVQILGATGDPLFDSAWRDGNVFDWQFEGSGQSLANGSYRCVVMVKDLDGRVTAREATFVARGGQISIEPRRADDGVTVVEGEESGPEVTILVHDEKDGAIVNTSGDLSFRFGKFFAGKDSEKMRLTAEGNLELEGVIRAKGIMFADGTVLGSVDGETANKEIRGANAAGQAIPQANATARRLTPRLNAPANQFVVDSAGVHIGTTSAFGLDVAGNVTLASNLTLPASSSTAGTILQGGSRLLHTFGGDNVFLGLNAGNFTMTGNANTASGVNTLQSNTTGFDNTASGWGALFSNTVGVRNTASGVRALQDNTGDRNTASGAFALRFNTSGSDNTASGVEALFINTTGVENTAIGRSALRNNNTGISNTAIGRSALQSTTIGGNNTASGHSALFSNTAGVSNTASGSSALYSNTTGSGNIAVGVAAGLSLTIGNNNIDIGNSGVADESATIRIGSGGTHTRFFAAGVRGVTTGAANAIAVLIDDSGQLGTVSSSARVKRDIASMGDDTAGLMHLRPVTFRYLGHGDNAPLQFGLIAEEVEEVYPELVARNKDGEAETVMYQFLAPMLLNQIQKQHRQMEEQDRRNGEQQKTIDRLEQRLQALERQVASRPN